MEVVDAPIDYNLLLGRSWTYAIEVVPSSYFRCIKFLHEGKLVTIDQLSFCNAPNEFGTVVPLVDNSTPACENIGVGIYSSLMGSFNINAPNESGTTVPLVDNSTLACENMGVSLYSSLMGSFRISTPILLVKSFPIYALTQVARDQGTLEGSFKTTYLSNPWTLPK